MEQWKVIGYQDVDFKAPDGNQVSGIRLFLTAPADPKKNGYGEICNSQFLSDRIDYAPVIGDTIQLSFNRYGKVQSVVVV